MSGAFQRRPDVLRSRVTRLPTWLALACMREALQTLFPVEQRVLELSIVAASLCLNCVLPAARVQALSFCRLRTLEPLPAVAHRTCPSVERLNVLSRGRRAYPVLLGSHSSAMRCGKPGSQDGWGKPPNSIPMTAFGVLALGLGLAWPARQVSFGYEVIVLTSWPCPATYSRTLMSPRQVPVRCGYFACPKAPQ